MNAKSVCLRLPWPNVAMRVCVYYNRLCPGERRTTTNPDAITCRSCRALLRKYPQLFALALAWRQPDLPFHVPPTLVELTDPPA